MANASVPSLRRALKTVDGAALLIGLSIGAGIFVVPQIIATYQSSYPGILGLWIGGALFAAVGGFIYSELGTRIPRTGGEYVYIHRCFGQFTGFMFGWAQLFIVRSSSLAGLSLIVANYVGFFVDLGQVQHTAVAVSVVAFLGVINYAGIERGSLFQKATTVLKVGSLLALVILAFALIGPDAEPLGKKSAATAELGPVGNSVAAMLLVLFAFLGWDRVGYVAGEMNDPRRTIPRTMLVGLGTVAVLYVLTVTSYHLTLGMDGVRGSEIVAADMVTILIGSGGAGVVACLVIISATGSMNGSMMTVPRALYAMAKDGLLFRWLDFVHPVHRTPSRAILAYCVWGVVLLIIRGSFETIVSGMVFVILFFYGLTTISVFILRRRDPGRTDIFHMPGYPWVPALYLAVIVALIALRGWYEFEASLIDLAFVAAGLPFAFWSVHRARRDNNLQADVD